MKTKYEQARDYAAQKRVEQEQRAPLMGGSVRIDFTLGADWGAAYERKIAAKLVETLKEIKAGCQFANFKASEALAAYESEE